MSLKEGDEKLKKNVFSLLPFVDTFYIYIKLLSYFSLG